MKTVIMEPDPETQRKQVQAGSWAGITLETYIWETPGEKHRENKRWQVMWAQHLLKLVVWRSHGAKVRRCVFVLLCFCAAGPGAVVCRCVCVFAVEVHR